MQSKTLKQRDIDFYISTKTRERVKREDPDQYAARIKDVYVMPEGRIEYVPRWVGHFVIPN